MITQLYPAISSPDKPPSLDYIKSQYFLNRTVFAQRNGEYTVLRRIFDGDFASRSEAKTKEGTPFQDRISLIYNVVNATIRRYMDSMSSPPRIECMPEGFELEDLELADKRTKFLEYIYRCNNMPIKLLQAAYYQSLLDKSIWHVRPAPHLPHKIRIELGVPDFYYPITRGDDWQSPLAVIYGFRTFSGNNFIRNPMVFQNSELFNNVIEYWDPNWFVRIENYPNSTQATSLQPLKVIAIPHKLGIIPWFETHNLPIPHRYRGQGDADQAVGLNEYLNMLMSAMGEMIAYAAGPIAVVRGTKVGGTNLPFEPRAVWELERDAQAGFLQWSGAPPSVEAQILRTIQAIEDTTGVSSPAFGREIPSGTSGSAVRSLLAGFNTRLGTKQQMLGESLSQVNEAIQIIAEKMFPNESFRIQGENIVPGRDLGKSKMYTVQPKELKGWYRNRVIFSPMDPAQTYFTEVDKWQKGLQSRYTTMKALGIQNCWDELERIRMEHEEKTVQENDMSQARAGNYQPKGSEQDDGQLQQLVDSIINHPGKGGKSQGVIEKEQKKAVASAANKQVSTGQVSAPSDGSLAPNPQSGKGIDINEALGRLRRAGTLNLNGRAAIIGGVDNPNPVIALDNPADQEAVREALGSMAPAFKFTVIDPQRALPMDAVSFYDPGQSKKKSGNRA